MTAAPVTLLFTDLVESTGLLQRVGDERAHRILHPAVAQCRYWSRLSSEKAPK
jgi:hypothetical protein